MLQDDVEHVSVYYPAVCVCVCTTCVWAHQVAEITGSALYVTLQRLTNGTAGQVTRCKARGKLY